jgi:hypothetical protein
MLEHVETKTEHNTAGIFEHYQVKQSKILWLEHTKSLL